MDFYKNDHPRYQKINDGCETLFSDLSEIISRKEIGLSLDQVTRLKEAIASELYYNYIVLHSPLTERALFQ
jgi:hypothetical protein